MKTFILNLSDSASVSLVYHTTFLKEVSVSCEIPEDANCVKVIGTIDFDHIVFDKKFYNAIKGKIDILDLSELKSSSSYNGLSLGLNRCSEWGYGGDIRIHRYKCLSFVKEIILPDKLNKMPMIRGLIELRKIVGRGLTTFDNESKTDCISGSNLSDCPKLEEIIFGSTIRNLSIRNSSIKRLNIPEGNGLLQLEPYGLAYNKELEEVHIPQNVRLLPIRLFEGCYNLRTITGGNGLEEIEFGAFGGCTNLHKVPFRIELLSENQFISYDEWMQYEPEDHQTSWWKHGDCAHCPKGVWLDNRWTPLCNYSIQEYCRDNDQRKWKPYKKGVVLSSGYIWCFDDFTYYETDDKADCWHKPRNVHKYVEFISPSITFVSEGDHVNINYNPQKKKASELSFPINKLAETIDLFFEDISYELILDEITRKVDELDIDAIIDSFSTTFSYCSFMMNSDTEGEEYKLDRSSKYTDEYLAKLLPPIHIDYNSRTALHVRVKDYVNPYKKKYDFGSQYSTFGKDGRDNCSYHWTDNILRDADNLEQKDGEIREEAREKYNREDHINFLVNCKISEIINKKLDIESRLHIKQAENEFNKRR